MFGRPIIRQKSNLVAIGIMERSTISSIQSISSQCARHNAPMKIWIAGYYTMAARCSPSDKGCNIEKRFYCTSCSCILLSNSRTPPALLHLKKELDGESLKVSCSVHWVQWSNISINNRYSLAMNWHSSIRLVSIFSNVSLLNLFLSGSVPRSAQIRTRTLESATASRERAPTSRPAASTT